MPLKTYSFITLLQLETHEVNYVFIYELIWNVVLMEVLLWRRQKVDKKLNILKTSLVKL